MQTYIAGGRELRNGWLWTKNVNAVWLEQNEAALASATHARYALIERPQRKRIAVEVFCDHRADARRLFQRFGGSLRRPQPIRSATHPPLRIGTRLTIVSAPPSSGDLNKVLIIPAGIAFGTGEHPTTAMSLRMLEQCSRRISDGWTMLDCGTGTGILALAAARFGAREVVAIDTDPLAIKAARQNAAANRIKHVKFILADAQTAKPGRQFDVIAANLFSDLLIDCAPRWLRQLRPAGKIILSGILREQERDVVRALQRSDLSAFQVRRRGKWVAVLAGRKTFLN